MTFFHIENAKSFHGGHESQHYIALSQIVSTYSNADVSAPMCSTSVALNVFVVSTRCDTKLPPLLFCASPILIAAILSFHTPAFRITVYVLEHSAVDN